MLIAADDEYEGYHFPKGTTFLANTWYASYHIRPVAPTLLA